MTDSTTVTQVTVWQEPTRTVARNRRLKDFATAALEVHPDQLRSYVPTILDIQIAQALLQGNITVSKIAEFTEHKDATILDALTDQVRAAYVFDQVHKLAGYRVGLVVSSLLRKAVAGDVRAIELYLKMFGKLADLHVVAHTDMDFTQFTDDDLKSQILSDAAGILQLESTESD